MPILSVRHVTTYAYARPVGFGEHRMMFRPRDSYDQRLIEAKLTVSPEPASVTWVHDVFGNCVTNVDFDTPPRSCASRPILSSIIRPSSFRNSGSSPPAKTWPIEYDEAIRPDLAPYLVVQNPSPELERWARQFTRSGLATESGHLLMTMTMGVRESFTYSRRTDPARRRRSSPFRSARAPAGTSPG